METLRLFRGDDINNLRTKPGIYRSNGIVSGAFGSNGNPLNVERIGLLETIKQHVDHLKGYEKDYYKITDYISFSESEDRAKEWASRKNPENLVICNDPYLETRYVFHVVIPYQELKPISEGVWEFNFSCNPNLKTPYKISEDNPLETIALDAALKLAGCDKCNPDYKGHSLVVVNTELLIRYLNEHNKYKRAVRLIKKNTEWLLLPNDRINFGFRSTRIQIADFWNVHGYTIIGEEKRDPFKLPYPGY